jgi:hypothetical protein
VATEVHQFACTIPAQTLIPNRLVFNLNFPPRIVDQIEVEVPPGPRGEVGFAIGQAGSPIFPYEQGTWIVADDKIFVWNLADANTSGAWQLFAYNTGAYNHVLYVRFLTRLPSDAAAVSAPELIESASLSQ